MTIKLLEVAGVRVDPRHFIGGRARRVERYVPRPLTDRRRPSSGTSPAAAATEVDLAVQAARDAFPGWAALGPVGRGAILNRVADLIEEHVEDLANLETADNGSLLRSHRRGVMPRVALNLRFFADWAINELRPPRLRHPRPHQPRELGPVRRRRGHHPVERTAHARDLAYRPRARGRGHRGAEAAGVGAAHRILLRRPRR